MKRRGEHGQQVLERESTYVPVKTKKPKRSAKRRMIDAKDNALESVTLFVVVFTLVMAAAAFFVIFLPDILAFLWG